MEEWGHGFKSNDDMFEHEIYSDKGFAKYMYIYVYSSCGCSTELKYTVTHVHVLLCSYLELLVFHQRILGSRPCRVLY